MGRLEVSRNLSEDTAWMAIPNWTKEYSVLHNVMISNKGIFRKQTLLRGWQDLLVCFWEVVSDGLHIIILGGFFLPPLLNFLSQQKFCDSVGKCGA